MVQEFEWKEMIETPKEDGLYLIHTKTGCTYTRYYHASIDADKPFKRCGKVIAWAEIPPVNVRVLSDHEIEVERLNLEIDALKSENMELSRRLNNLRNSILAEKLDKKK